MQFLRQTLFWLAVAWASASSAWAEPLPRSVLIINQSVSGRPWYLGFSSSFQATLNSKSATAISVYSEDLDLNRFGGARYEALVLGDS